MATILFTWELGQGLGHLLPIASLARQLAERGHRVAVALREHDRALEYFGGTEVMLLPATFRYGPAQHPMRPTTSFARFLNNACFDTPDQAFTRFVAWRNLFELIQPDVVVFDHSPTALAASRGLDLRRVVMGTGFFWPPNVEPMPVVRPDLPADALATAEDERRVLQNVNDALARLGAPPLPRLAELYHQADDALLTTFPELDHFGARPEARYYGVISRSGGDRPVWPDGDGPRVYAYLKPFRTIDALLQKLTDLRLPTLIYPDGINHATRDRFAGPTLRFAERRLDLDAVGDQADLAILNANHATTAELLLKGVPSFHLPISTEQARLADRLESTGACHRASYVDLDSVFSALHRMLDDMGSHRIHAEAFARKHAEFDSETSSRNMTERILEIASSRSADTPRPVPPPTATVPSLGRRSVLVLGCGRSGTSMVTGVLANAGWRLGGRPFPPGQSNPKGFFETGEVNSINERLLAELFPEPQFRYGQRWLCRVPAGARFEPTPEIVAQIAHLASERPFAFKDPRFCDTLPAWRPHIDNAAFICVFRHPAVTAQSILTECESRTYLKDMTMSFNLALAIWTSKYEQALRRHAEGGDWLFIHYDQMLTAAGLDRLERFVGAPVDRSFPTSSLARTQCNKPVPHPVQQLYARLCELADVSTTPNAAASR